MLFILLPVFASAQKNVVHGQAIWLRKQLDLGDTVDLKVIITRDKEAEVSIPDTFKAFKPYELIHIGKMQRKDAGDDKVVEETVFKVRSFLVDTLQNIRLPLEISYKNKTTKDSTTEDAIRFVPRIREVTPDLKYLAQPELATVHPPADRRMIFAFIGGGLLLAGGLAYALRKPVRRWWRKRNLQAEWLKTRQRIQNEREKLTTDSQEAVTAINVLWKSYLQPAIPVKVELRSQTAWEIDQTLSSHPELQPEDVTVLSEWCRAEELIIYARQNYGKEQLNHLLNQLIKILESEFLRRKRAIK